MRFLYTTFSKSDTKISNYRYTTFSKSDTKNLQIIDMLIFLLNLFGSTFLKVDYIKRILLFFGSSTKHLERSQYNFVFFM